MVQSFLPLLSTKQKIKKAYNHNVIYRNDLLIEFFLKNIMKRNFSNVGKTQKVSFWTNRQINKK